MTAMRIGTLAKRARVGIDTLEKVRNGLSSLTAACPVHGRAEDCPILKALGGEDS